MNTATLASLVASVGSMAPAADDADRIERVRLFEELKSVAAAAQAAQTAVFVLSQKAAQAAAGVPVERQGRGVAAQIGLARRIGPWQAQRYVGWALILTTELPHTFAALRCGQITEWRAMIVARETIWLSRADRAQVDADLAPRLEGWGDRQVEAEAKKAAYRLDPHGFPDRVRGAAKDRRVTMRPAPDTMARLTAFLPVAQAVAGYAALCKAADLTTAAGDERGRGQIMADTLIERVTGQTTADAVPVEIELIMTPPCSPPTTPTTPTTPTRVGSVANQDCSSASARSPPHWPANSPWAATATPHAAGSAACSCTPPPGNSPPWTARTACSPPTSAASSACATTAPAAPPGATHPSRTPTTSNPTTTAAPQPPTTAKTPASHATTQNKPPAGKPTRSATAPSPPKHPPATATTANHPTHPAAHPATNHLSNDDFGHYSRSRDLVRRSCEAGHRRRARLRTTLSMGDCGVHPSIGGQALLALAVEQAIRR